MALSKEEKEILDSIVVPSYNDPSKPEFPPYAPNFPASETCQIDVPGFSNVWVKDESVHRYSGTHKDRLAWEVVILYRDFLLAKERGVFEGDLPQFSMITAGSAGLAVGRYLRAYGLPKLKVLIDKKLPDNLQNALKDGHCEIYHIDLSEKSLSPEEILERTENMDGFDLTSNQGISLEIGNYDWMGFEIIDIKADYVFIPFGTGIIFRKVMELNKMQLSSFGVKDPRFKGNLETLRQCSYLAATSKTPNTIADKLYSSFMPFPYIKSDWVKFYKTAGYCGSLTDIYPVEEKFVRKGYELAYEKGMNCEPSGAAGLSLLLQLQDKIPRDKKILIINTGKLKVDENEIKE